MMEKKVFRGFLCSVVLLAAAFLLLSLAADLIWNGNYTDTLPISAPGDPAECILEGDNVLELRESKPVNGGMAVQLHGVAPGRCRLIIRNGSGETAYDFRVLNSGRVINETNGNFSVFHVHLLLIVLAVAALSGVLWLAYFRAKRVLLYSYQCIFYCGFGIWTSIVAIFVITEYALHASAFTIYSTLQESGWRFILYTSPLMVLFCIALCISNIVLIRREHFRVNNALGIILSLIIIFGMTSALWLNLMDFSGSQDEMNIRSFIAEAYAAVFVLFECFLQGAIICGSSAAKHVPNHDVDYIIILGCRFRKDGTLFPLIQGRVDRALDFYRDQIARGGKHPVLIPSGGQGRDEIMSEAEAMRNYILAQGIPESDVLIENKSRTTVENMRFSRALIDAANPNAKTAFSTTNYHVFRSGIISRQAGFEPEGMGSRTKWYFWPNAYIRECIGMAVFMKKRIIAIVIALIALFAVLQFIL